MRKHILSAWSQACFAILSVSFSVGAVYFTHDIYYVMHKTHTVVYFLSLIKSNAAGLLHGKEA